MLYAARERVDIMYTVKELSGSMSAPTVRSLQKLRKRVGYLKASGEMGIKLNFAEWGAEWGTGKWKDGGDRFWNVETFTDADWAGHKVHRKSTSCSVRHISNNFVYASSRTQ